MSIECKHIIEAMEKYAPRFIAEKWDNIGLLLGSSKKTIHSVLITLDVRPEVVDEAIAKKVDLIISHHPIIFESMKSISTDNPQGALVSKLLQHDIGVYSAHTNLDSAVGGINDLLAQKLCLTNVKPLAVSYKEPMFKLVVFVPATHFELVRQAICEAGGGHIGNYSHCTFAAEGIGSFMPLSGTNPFIGSLNKLEYVKEYRLETIVPASLLSSVTAAMLEVHPYEEVAYDVIPLKNKAFHFGLGRVGELANGHKFTEFCDSLKQLLQVSVLKIAGMTDEVKRVALCGGSGMSLLSEVIKAKADVFITGDVKYHDAQAAVDQGVVVLDAGHYATEQLIVSYLQTYLAQCSKEEAWDIKINVSEKNKDIFSYV